MKATVVLKILVETTNDPGMEYNPKETIRHAANALNRQPNLVKLEGCWVMQSQIAGIFSEGGKEI